MDFLLQYFDEQMNIKTHLTFTDGTQMHDIFPFFGLLFSLVK